MPENEHEADVNAQDEAGRTALTYAADLCHTWDVRRSSMVEPTQHFRQTRKNSAGTAARFGWGRQVRHGTRE